ncbi:MAG: hypothetical protein BGN92_07200 [Sphingobacteriales bacterium 41-5]|nr:MAG: hypothetical protein BGN92_07200 [Sphingobacteriales bacterium 41-5]
MISRFLLLIITLLVIGVSVIGNPYPANVFNSWAGNSNQIQANDFSTHYPPSIGDSVYTITKLFDTVSETSYFLTEINSNKTNLQMALAGKIAGETGTEFAKRMDCCIAFNASLGINNPPPGERHPIGIQIVDGVIIQDNINSRRYTLGIKPENVLVAYPPYETASNILNDGANYALTAFTPLIEKHKAVSQSVLNTVGNYKVKHPRQVIAQYDNGNILVLSCGGRGYDGKGMTAADVIRILSALDVRFAFMLDGGGSVTTMVKGKRITPMIDEHGTIERPRPNWLYIRCQHNK